MYEWISIVATSCFFVAGFAAVWAIVAAIRVQNRREW